MTTKTREELYKEECSKMTIPNHSVYDNYEFFYISGRKASDQEIEQLKNIVKKLLELETHYEDCSWFSDDEDCDCGTEKNYYSKAREILK